MAFSRKVFLISFSVSFVFLGSVFLAISNDRDVPEVPEETSEEIQSKEEVANATDDIAEIYDDGKVVIKDDWTVINRSSSAVNEEYTNNPYDGEGDYYSSSDKGSLEENISYQVGELIIKYVGSASEEELVSQMQTVTGLSDITLTNLTGSIYLVESKQMGQAAMDYFTSSVRSEDVSEQIDPQLISVLEKVKNISGVAYSEPDYKVSVAFTPNDAYYESDQWALNNTGQTGGTADADIDAPEAWDIEMGSSSVVVAVIDTGVDLDHPDLDSKILKDGGGNVIGYDFVNSDSDPNDDNGHGTHCAGVIAAETNNTIGVAGVCPNCKIMPLKFLDSYGGGWTSDAVLSIDYAIDHGADILSNSWAGYGYSQALQDVITEAYNQGILTVAASGNENTSQPSYPATMEHVVSVAAIDHNDVRAWFSNYGNYLDVSAPGVNILSTILPGAYLSSSCRDANHGGASDGYGMCSGTSMAAPFVAGVAALIQSSNPSFSARDIARRIYETADDLGNPGWDLYYGFGRVNAYNAVNSSFVVPAYIKAVIAHPVENQLFGEQITIEGSAFAKNFTSYEIEVGYGTNPSLWRTEGITLTNGGSSEVMEGELGIWDASGLNSGVWTIRLTVFAASGQKESLVRVNNSDILEEGFPVQTWHGPGTFHGGRAIHTLVDDITGDGYNEILVTGLATGPLYAFDHNGNLLPGWPVSSTSGGAAYPVSYNGIVVAGHFGDEIAAFNADGDTLWEIGVNFVATPPSIGYVSRVLGYGIFTEEEDWDLHGYDLGGVSLPGWPVDTHNGQELHTPAIADIDKDGEIEIISASGWISGGVDLYAVNEDGSILWTTHFANAGVDTFPTVGDVDDDGDLEVVVISEQDAYPWTAIVNIVDSEGNIERSWMLNDRFSYSTAPALADLDGDRVPEIVVQTNGYLYVTDGFGSSLPGWPLAITQGEWLGNSGPVVGDVDGDLQYEIVFTSEYPGSATRGYMHVVNHDGTYLEGYPRQMYIGGGAVPAISDIDNDNHNEIIITSDYWNGNSGYYDKVWVFDLNRNEPNVIHRGIEWGQFCHDAQHTCTYEPRTVGDADMSITISDSPDPVFSGEELTYTLRVRNNSPSTAHQISFTQELPDTVEFVSATPQQGTCSYWNGRVSCKINSLGAFATREVTVVVVPTGEGGDRTITTTAWVSAQEDDPNWNNNADSEDTQVITIESDLEVVYMVDVDDPVAVSDFLLYDIQVITNGPDTVDDAVVTVTLSDHLLYNFSVPDQGSCSESSGIVTCQLGQLTPGTPVNIAVITTAIIPGHITSYAEIASNSAIDPDPGNNSNYEETDIVALDYSALQMVYPADGQVLQWGAGKSYMFDVVERAYAVGYEYEFWQNGSMIHKELTADLTGEFAIHPDHPKYADFEVGYVEVRIRAKFFNDEYTNVRVITIALVDYSNLEAPTVIAPTDGEVIAYNTIYTVEVEEVFGAGYYLYGFFQGGELVYEEMVTEASLEVYMGSPEFSEGEVEIWVRAWLGNNWTKAKVVTVTLE